MDRSRLRLAVVPIPYIGLRLLDGSVTLHVMLLGMRQFQEETMTGLFAVFADQRLQSQLTAQLANPTAAAARFYHHQVGPVGV